VLNCVQRVPTVWVAGYDTEEFVRPIGQVTVQSAKR
jgi:hypothetical protein